MTIEKGRVKSPLEMDVVMLKVRLAGLFIERYSFLSFLFNYAVDIPHLVYELRDVKGKYYHFGLLLHVPDSQLDAWDSQHNKKADIILHTIVNFLFDNKNKDDSFEIIFTALDCMDKSQLAERLKSRYGKSQGNLIIFIYIVQLFFINFLCFQRRKVR